jgi:hypothetical protein
LYAQFWEWIKQALLGGEGVFLYGFWKARNRACFDKILIKNSLRYYGADMCFHEAGLYPEDMQAVITAGG